MMRSEFKRFGKGFVYAWNGIRAAVREERNFRFHLCAAVFVYMAAALAEISPVETALLTICVFLVMALELMNSAVERAVDKPDTSHWWSAGAAKDMAAGAVLAAAVGAVVVAVCVFGTAGRPALLWHKLTDAPLRLAGLLAMLLVSTVFIFHKPNQQQKGQ